MKKFIMTLVAAVAMTVSANAQVYLGGSLGIGGSKVNGGDNVTTYQVLPEIGYKFDKDWAIGTVVGFGKATPGELVTNSTLDTENSSRNYVTVQPYVRYTFVHSKYVNVFVDGGFGYTHLNHAGTGVSDQPQVSYNAWTVGLRPGIEVNLNKKVSFVAHIGFAGYNTIKGDYDGAKSSDAWGVKLDGNNVTFGVYYNF